MNKTDQSELIAFYGPIYGPIDPIPENYKPKVLISDEEYNTICDKRDKGEKLTCADEFFGRDYVVDQSLRCIGSEDYESMDAFMMKLSDKRLADLFAGLETCSCCWRHCHNTPERYDSWEDRNQLDVATIEMVSERNCFCHCRMVKRSIRWAFFANKKLDEAPDS